MLFNTLNTVDAKKARRRRALMIQAGVTQAEIARRLMVTPAAVSRVVNGHAKSARIQTYIARRLGLPVDELWPERRAA